MVVRRTQDPLFEVLPVLATGAGDFGSAGVAHFAQAAIVVGFEVGAVGCAAGIALGVQTGVSRTCDGGAFHGRYS
jgi:hypothetical protein